MPYEIKIKKENAGSKPKNFLKKKLDLPFYQLVKNIKDKRITLNGKKIKQDSILREGDIIKIWKDDIKLREPNQLEKKEIKYKDLKIDLIFENEDFLILNKPPGVVVQGSQDNKTSLSLHLNYLKKKNNEKSDFNYFHVHRIDKNTSGLIICAKNYCSLKKLNEIFRTRKIIKKYLCLVSGNFKKKEDEIEVYMKRNPEGSRQKVSVVQNSKVGDGAKKTITKYKIISKYKFGGEIFTLLEVEIKTGFMHQIRVLMKHLNHPIVGDPMYGNSFINQKFEDSLKRQFLHASEVSFKFNDGDYTFKAELSKDLKQTLLKLKEG